VNPSRRSTLGRLATLPALALAALAMPARAHGFRHGSIDIDHPYALPTVAGIPNGAVYLRRLRNRGAQAERLLGASTPVARAVEIHQSTLGDDQVMRMRAAAALELPPGRELQLRHGGPWHLMLLDLKQPLALGQRFPMRLRFERAGETEVVVWVQQPRRHDAQAGHRH
jgi:periplasmic copper chaperone A